MLSILKAMVYIIVKKVSVKYVKQRAESVICFADFLFIKHLKASIQMKR